MLCCLRMGMLCCLCGRAVAPNMRLASWLAGFHNAAELLPPCLLPGAPQAGVAADAHACGGLRHATGRRLASAAYLRASHLCVVCGLSAGASGEWGSGPAGWRQLALERHCVFPFELAATCCSRRVNCKP